MAKMETVRLIRLDDLKRYGDVPKWVPGLIDPLNQFMETVITALRKNVNINDNLAGSVVELTFVHGVEKVVDPKTPRRVLGVLPLFTENESLDYFQWRYVPKEANRIGLTFGFLSATTDPVKCRTFLLTE